MYNPPNRLFSPESVAQFVVTTLEALAEIFPSLPACAVPKYMSPTAQPLVATLTVASLISTVESPTPLSVVQSLVSPLAATRAKSLGKPSG